MQSTVLPFFWHLASSSKDARLGASADLVISLEGFQRSFLEARGGQVNGYSGEDEDDDDDDEEDEDDSEESGVEVDEDSGDEGEDDAPAKKLDKQLTVRNAEDVVYSLKRLVRGLASSRESSRLGFAVALTEVSLDARLARCKLTGRSFYPAWNPSQQPKSCPSSSVHSRIPNR